MRESIARSTDFLTGEIKEVTKLKPVDSVAKGIHTIQLFDANNGQLVKEVESENFIAVTWDEIQKIVAKMALMTQDFNYGSDDGLALYNRASNTAGKRLLTYYQNYRKLFGHTFNKENNFVTPFAYVLLTTDGEAESPTTERVLKGETVGYAEREVTYSGADTRRGSFNSAESLIENKHIKYVWDFPTHASNGVIKSLVWNSGIDSNRLAVLPNGSFKLQTHDTDASFLASGEGFYFVNGKVYVITRKQNALSSNRYDYSAEVYQIDLTTRSATYLETRPLVVSSPYDVHRISVDPDTEDIYYYYDGSFYGKKKDGTPVTFARNYNSDNWFLEGVFVHDGIMYTRGQRSNDGQLMGIKMSDNTDYMPLHKPQDASGHMYRGVYVEGFGMAIEFGEDWYFYDNIANAFTRSDKAPRRVIGVRGGMNNMGGVPFRDTNGEIAIMTAVMESYNSKEALFEIHPIGRIGGRNLLPSPIEKTADYTMKVTYDLYFE